MITTNFSIDTFSNILLSLMQSTGLSAKNMCKFLQDRNCDISYQAFVKYKNYQRIPDFIRAKSILNALNYPITDEELEMVLKYSRKLFEKKELGESGNSKIRATLEPDLYGENMDQDLLDAMLEQRIKQQFNGSTDEYINYLIRKDLIEAGFIPAE